MKKNLTLKLSIILTIIIMVNFAAGKKEKQLYSILEIYDITTNKREVILKEKVHFEAPNWSMDGKFLIINSSGKLYKIDLDKKTKELIFIVPINGGIPQLITDKAPSFWHGISPDGQTLVYTAERDNVFNIYGIDINGGDEKQLTNTSVLDDGPDFSPDGKYIYYNTFDSGSMEIWRMTSFQIGFRIQILMVKI